MAKRRNDPSDKKSVPTRDNSKMDSEEQEFWNLGEDGDDSPPEDPDDPEALDDLDDPEADDLDEFDDIDDSGMNEDEDDLDDLDDDDEDSDDSPLDEEEDDDEDAEDEEPPGDPGDADSAEETPPPASSHQRPAAGKGEKIALAALGAVLLIGALWGLSVFVGSLPEGNDDQNVKFPVAGTSVTIAAADTYWRAPDRTTDKGVRMDTRLIPAAVIKLKDNPGSCALRFFFSDDTGELVGDPTTHAVSAGRFATNGSDQIEVHGTAGFADPGDHAAYTTEQIDTWHLVIMEGPDQNARGSDFKQIARVPISYDRR